MPNEQAISAAVLLLCANLNTQMESKDYMSARETLTRIIQAASPYDTGDNWANEALSYAWTIHDEINNFTDPKGGIGRIH